MIKLKLLKLTKFGLVGVITTLFGIISYYVLLDIYAFPLYPTYVTVFLIGVGLSYFLNSIFTFKESTSLNKGVKYYGVYILSLAIGLLLLKVLEILIPSISDFYKTLIIIPPRFIITYFILNKTIFKIDKTHI